MKGKKWHSWIWMFCLVFVILAGFFSTAVVWADEPVKSSEYFPIEIGDKWEYSIDVGEIQPILAYNIFVGVYIASEKNFAEFSSSQKRVTRGQKDKNQYSLVIVVKEKKDLAYPSVYIAEEVVLDIQKDELGIYKDYKEVYWGIQKSEKFEVVQINIFDHSTLSSSEAERLEPDAKVFYETGLFFLGRNDDVMEYGIEKIKKILSGEFASLIKPEEKFTFLNKENDLLHFRKEVKEMAYSDPKYPYCGFTEDTWFKKGVGLSKLEQKIGDKTAMIWTLVNYTPGIKKEITPS